MIFPRWNTAADDLSTLEYGVHKLDAIQVGGEFLLTDGASQHSLLLKIKSIYATGEQMFRA